MDNMRERLIDLLKGAETKVAEMLSAPLALEEWLGIYADNLIENGVILTPCKVGDTVWYELYGKIESAVVYSCVAVLKKQGLKITDANAKDCDGLEVAFNGECIGKTVFLTREEAEKALKERGG